MNHKALKVCDAIGVKERELNKYQNQAIKFLKKNHVVSELIEKFSNDTEDDKKLLIICTLAAYYVSSFIKEAKLHKVFKRLDDAILDKLAFKLGATDWRK